MTRELSAIGPLSLWDRVRFMAACPVVPGPHPRPLSQRMRGDWRRVILLVLCLVAVGCTRDIERMYGRRQGFGQQSVNGTGVLGKMFRQAGHRVFSWSVLSPRLHQRADVVVWFPNDFEPPTDEVRAWLEDWLTEEPGRTLVYVGRDFDAAAPYWAKVEPLAPEDQREEVRRRESFDRTDFLSGRLAIPESEDCGWFTVEREHRPRKVVTLDGEPEWLEGIDPAGLEIELAGRMLPSENAEVVLASEGDMLVSVESWDESQALVVANGSFLLNFALLNHEHRKLAGKLIDAVGPAGQTVVFLESGPGGPPIREKDPEASTPSGLALFRIWPMSWILLHLAVAGILFCFARWPIFGRRWQPPPPPASDFGRHVEALGELLEQSGAEDFAAARLGHYREVLHPEHGVTRESHTKPQVPGAAAPELDGKNLPSP